MADTSKGIHIRSTELELLDNDARRVGNETFGAPAGDVVIVPAGAWHVPVL